jgi:hypothetical protein
MEQGSPPMMFKRSRLLWNDEIEHLRQLMQKPHTKETHDAIDEYAAKYDLDKHQFMSTGPLAHAILTGCATCTLLMLHHKSDPYAAKRDLERIQSFGFYTQLNDNQLACFNLISPKNKKNT